MKAELHNASKCLIALVVALDFFYTFFTGVATVAVHDEGDMTGILIGLNVLKLDA